MKKLKFTSALLATVMAGSVFAACTSTGGDETEGTLEYVGTADDICTERPIWLYGDGAFKNNGTAKIRFRGVSSVTPEENPAARAVTFTAQGNFLGFGHVFLHTAASSLLGST